MASTRKDMKCNIETILEIKITIEAESIDVSEKKMTWKMNLRKYRSRWKEKTRQ